MDHARVRRQRPGAEDGPTRRAALHVSVRQEIPTRGLGAVRRYRYQRRQRHDDGET